jgi:hypothetical protein
MAGLRTIELNVLQSIREVASVYQTYEKNFNDVKYAEINNCFIQPMVQRTDALMWAFDEMGRTVATFKEKNIIQEEG